MKRIFVLIIALSLILCGCGSKQTQNSVDESTAATLPQIEATNPTDEPITTTPDPEVEENIWNVETETVPIEIPSQTVNKEDIELLVTTLKSDDELAMQSSFGKQYLSWYTMDKETITFDPDSANVRIEKSHFLVGNQNDIYSYVIVETKTDASNYDGIKEVALYFTNLKINTVTQAEICEFARLYFGDAAKALVYANDKDNRTYDGEMINSESMLVLSEKVESEHCNYFVEREISINHNGDYELILRVGVIEDDVKYLETKADSSYDDFVINMSNCVLEDFGDNDPFNKSTFANGLYGEADFGYANTTVEKIELTTVNHNGATYRHIDLDFIGNTEREYHVRTNYKIGYTEAFGKATSIAILSESSTYVDPYKYDIKAAHSIAVDVAAGLFIDENINKMPFNDRLPGISATKTTVPIEGIKTTGTVFINLIDKQPNRSLILWEINDMEAVVPSLLLDPWGFYDF